MLSPLRKQDDLRDHEYAVRFADARQTWHEVSLKARFLLRLLQCGFSGGDCAAAGAGAV